MGKTAIKMENNWIDCTGDACIGDYVEFERAMFSETNFSYRHRSKPQFLGYETVSGTIIRDSYGAKKQQHTFTIDTGDGVLIRIKGRNLYRNGCKRLLWNNEFLRHDALAEKHIRGELARTARYERKSAF
jgi:(S)-2-hydroxy-acid oxidase